VNGESAYGNGFGVLAECSGVSGLIVRTVAPAAGTPIEHRVLSQEKFGCLDFQRLNTGTYDSIGCGLCDSGWGENFLAESVHDGRKRAVTRLYLYSGTGIKTETKQNNGKLQLW